MSNATFAAVNQSQIKDFSSKLETNKTKLIKNIDESKVKLKNVAKEASKFSDTSLFKAASCLGAIPVEDQNLNFDKITTTLKEEILNEYIKLDGEIKRLSFGMKESDPLIFGNSLDNFYNQNALKITGLESDYYSKSAQVRKIYEQYIKNNEALLETLAGRIDTLAKVDKAMNEVNKSFSGLNNAIDKQTNLWKNLENTRVDLGKSLDSQLSQIISETNGS